MVLKLPNHVGFIDTLLDTFPSACVVQTHRDPAVVVASYASLATTVHGAASERVDCQRMGEASLSLWGILADRCVAARRSLPEGRVLDVDYDALRAAPVETVRKVHRHFDLPVAGPWLDAAVAARPAHRHGRHVYALEDFGLRLERIRARFADYSDAYLV